MLTSTMYVPFNPICLNQTICSRTNVNYSYSLFELPNQENTYTHRCVTSVQKKKPNCIFMSFPPCVVG